MSHSQENPGHGSTAEVDSFKSTQISRVTACSGVSTGLTAILNSEAASSWQSASATAWRERMARVFPMLDAASQVVRPWRDAAATYHTTLDDITRRANASFHDISTGHTMLNAFSHVPYEVSSTPDFQAKIQRYQDEINDGYVNLQYLRELRDSANVLFASFLNEHGVLGENRDWVALQGLYGDAKSVADIRAARTELVAANTALGNKVLSGDASTEDIDALAKFLAASSGDPALAALYWDNYSGDEVTTMLATGVQKKSDAAGGSDQKAAEDAIDFAESLRASFSAASITWDQATADRYAAEMWAGPFPMAAPGTPPPALAEIGFLFDDADNHALAERFTVAMADQFDAFERADNGLGGPKGPATSGFESFSTGGGVANSRFTQYMWYAAGGETSESGLPIGDPMSRVLETLGHYPNSAYDWLSSTDSTLANGETPVSSDRAVYYASRDWSADGWIGFGTLWEGSMHADGGFMSNQSDPVVWDGMCDLSARTVNGLAVGMADVPPGDLPEPGSELLAQSLAHLMPFASTALEATPVPRGDGMLVVDDWEVIGFDGDVNVPAFNNESLGKLIGQVASTESGFATLRVAVTDVENMYIARADMDSRGASDDGQFIAWNSAKESVYKLEANFEGAVGGASVVRGQYDDNVLREKIGFMEDLAGLMPLPKLELIPGAGEALDAGLGVGVSSAADWYENAVVNNEYWAIKLADCQDLLGNALLNAQFSRIANDENMTLGDVAKSEYEHKEVDQLLASYDRDYIAYYKANEWGATH